MPYKYRSGGAAQAKTRPDDSAVRSPIQPDRVCASEGSVHRQRAFNDGCGSFPALPEVHRPQGRRRGLIYPERHRSAWRWSHRRPTGRTARRRSTQGAGPILPARERANLAGTPFGFSERGRFRRHHDRCRGDGRPPCRRSGGLVGEANKGRGNQDRDRKMRKEANTRDEGETKGGKVHGIIALNRQDETVGARRGEGDPPSKSR